MRNFNDRNLIKAAKTLGLKIKFNSEKPGVTFVSEDGNRNTVTWDKIKKI